MKKSIFILLCFLPVLCANAVTVEITEGIDNLTLKKKIEHNASVLLTEINRAQSSNTELDFTYLLKALPQNARESLRYLWATSPFKCTQELVSVRLLYTSTGYEIRNIPLLMGSEIVPADERKQEGVIIFDKSGSIVGLHTALAQHQYNEIIKANPKRVDDLERRQIIADFVEEYRTAWIAKDIDYLDKIFNENALIITGTVIQSKTTDGVKLPDKIRYNVKSKQEYMASLKNIFKDTTLSIRIIFDDIEIVAHPNPLYRNYYGVTLRQVYASYSRTKGTHYGDKGYVFLLWKFPEKGTDEMPQIWARTWQREKDLDKYPEEKIGLETFKDGLW